jgi:hypothetical protein
VKVSTETLTCPRSALWPGLPMRVVYGGARRRGRGVWLIVGLVDLFEPRMRPLCFATRLPKPPALRKFTQTANAVNVAATRLSSLLLPCPAGVETPAMIVRLTSVKSHGSPLIECASRFDAVRRQPNG